MSCAMQICVAYFILLVRAMKEYGLIGRPLGHSASAKYFADKFAMQSIDANYSLYELNQIEEVEQLRAKLCGFNVTIPYKKQILPFLASVSDEAAKVGAVNCVKIDSEGKMHGYNTDVVGIRATLSKFELQGKKALVLGTGGAAAAVLFVLEQLGMEVTSVSRTAGENRITYDIVTPELIASTTLIVNATPVGMYPHTDEAPTLPYEALTPNHILFDLIYNPAKTLFLTLGEQRGAKVVGGDEMFRRQAEASWEIWNR